MPRTLFIIPAKATSARIPPSKNLRLLGGVPLVLWTIRAAMEAAGPEDMVVVSTDEGDAGDPIARLAVDAGARAIRRPLMLCRDPAQMPDVALNVLQSYNVAAQIPETVCVLLPTSPFRGARHIREALALHRRARENVLSVGCPLRTALHQKLCLLGANGRIYAGPPLRDPALAETRVVRDGVALNGAMWITTPPQLIRDQHISAMFAVPYVMDDESGLDIDTEVDFRHAEAMLAHRSDGDQLSVTRPRA
jgi:CMP-N,N'-diacetyllegionaminic acid synthase